MGRIKRPALLIELCDVTDRRAVGSYRTEQQLTQHIGFTPLSARRRFTELTGWSYGLLEIKKSLTGSVCRTHRRFSAKLGSSSKREIFAVKIPLPAIVASTAIGAYPRADRDRAKMFLLCGGCCVDTPNIRSMSNSARRRRS
ncbi:hypothetical protein BaRGS_00014424 [Batillaria attramentaria]|uniref:Uncharacterized protein n=1 Tax=Batillaria attramentaria TaxID=370345 RepID=A0ABD0L481_9CAEN